MLALAVVLVALLSHAAMVPRTALEFAVDQPPPGVELDDFYELEYSATAAYRWSRPEAQLSVPVNAPARYRVTLTLEDSPTARPPRPVVVHINGQPAGTVLLEARPLAYSFEYTFPRTSWKRGQAAVLQVDLGVAPFVPSEAPRPLGVVLTRVAVAPVGSPSPWAPALLLPNLLLLVAGYTLARDLGAPTGAAAALGGLALAAYAALALGARPTALSLAYQPATFGVLLVALCLPALWPTRRRAVPAETSDAVGGARPPGSQAPRGLRPATWRAALFVLLLLFCYGAFHPLPASNELSRYNLVRAMVLQRTTRIDAYHQNTQDKAFHQGHYYSDKAPGSALLAAPVFALLRGLVATEGDPAATTTREVSTLAFAVSGLPTALAALLLLRYLRRRVAEWWALAVSAGFALGTIACPLATAYFGHAAAMAFLFGAFYTLSRTAAPATWRAPLLAGLLAGWAVLVEYPTLFGVGILLVYSLSHGRRAPLLMVAGALPAALLLLGYNWLSFGRPFSLGYANLADPGFAAGMGRGLFGIGLPTPSTLHEILLGWRGLLSLAPWLILTPLGLWYGWRTATGRLRQEVVVCGAIGAVFLLYNAGYYLPLGGVSPGPRFLAPALPFAAILVALVPGRFRPAISAQIAVSIGIFLVVTATFPLLPASVQDPLASFWLPRLQAGDLVETVWQRRGLYGFQPLVVLALALTVAGAGLLATTRSGPAARRLMVASLAVLAGLVAAAALPIDLRRGLGVPTRAVEGTGEEAFAISDVGISPAGYSSLDLALWARVANRGDPTVVAVVFSVYGPSGERVWIGKTSPAAWPAQGRKRLEHAWSIVSAPPGDYRIGVVVESPDGQTVLARWDHAARVRLQPAPP